MDANPRHLERIFDQTITYQIPLFQRPYVWTQTKNWEPLWEDIQALLDKSLKGSMVHAHFLGAVVLEQLANATGSIESRQVIDGQQRFTTMQLFLLAARDIAKAHGVDKFIERFSDLVTNRRSKIDDDDEVFKVWPTNGDRPAFRVVHQAGSPEGLDQAVKRHADPTSLSANILGAYRYFHGQISQWLSGKLDDVDDKVVLASKVFDERMDALWQVVKGCLIVVVIDVTKEDDTQVIFETLNARGEDLLPADLIKNFLFRRAAADGSETAEKVEALYETYWRQFETEYWRSEIKQGRLYKPRIDVFISHYLTLMTLEEVRFSHLFNAFKAFALLDKTPAGSTIPLPKTPAKHIEQMADYAKVFRTLQGTAGHPRLATFLQRLETVDTSTVFPFLMHAYVQLMPDHQVEFDNILGIIESFLYRRLICNLTTKNYNHVFLSLLRTIEEKQRVTAEDVEAYFAQADGESTRFPTDTDVSNAVNGKLYGKIAVAKVRAVLEALDAFAHDRKTEAQAPPPNLTVEHVMPQTWQTHWPLPEHVQGDPIAELKATTARDIAVNCLGNLTLITGEFNSSLSNAAWTTKRPELLKYSKLNLTRYFHGSEADTWNEETISTRATYLWGQLLKIWPDVKRPVVAEG